MLETRQLPARHDADDIAERLRGSRAPALVVAPVEARLVATNPAGARALGMAATAQPAHGLSLDSAMPAIMQLRRLAGLPDVALHGVVEPLVFWTPGGAARFLCRVRTLDDSLGRHLMLVEPLDHEANDADPDDVGEPSAQTETDTAMDAMADAVIAAKAEPVATAAKRSSDTADDGELDAAPAAPTPAAAPVRDDAAILRAIARQILGDQQAAAAVPASTGVSLRGTGTLRAAKTAARNRAKPAARDMILLGDDAPTATGAAGPAAEDPACALASSAMAGSAGAAAGGGGSGDGSSAGDGNRDGDGGDGEHRHKRAPGAVQGGMDPALPATGDAPAQLAPATAEAPATAPPARPASSSRRALARRIAHELKSPLSAIAAAAEIMKDERFGPIGDDRYLRYARDIHESARHALDVVQRMLGAEVDAAAAPQLEFTDLDLNAVVAAMVSAMEPVAAEAGVRLSASLAAHLPRIVADGTSVRQMALNLVTNAVKFTPPGGEVIVSTRAEVDGPLTLEVTDSGTGMSAAEIARIDAGGVIDEPAARKGGGLGIGLPLVRSLAAANGASLVISTRSVGGTVAAIVFPKTRQVLV